MENATKALIIAGAVLISILLISVGIMVFNAANEPINQAQNSSASQAVQMFNEPFTANLGDDLTGQQVRSLLSSVIASNSKNQDRQITITYGSYSYGDKAKTLSVGRIPTNKRYNAQVEEYDNDGYIKTIKIEDASNKNANPQ